MQSRNWSLGYERLIAGQGSFTIVWPWLGEVCVGCGVRCVRCVVWSEVCDWYWCVVCWVRCVEWGVWKVLCVKFGVWCVWWGVWDGVWGEVCGVCGVVCGVLICCFCFEIIWSDYSLILVSSSLVSALKQVAAYAISFIILCDCQWIYRKIWSSYMTWSDSALYRRMLTARSYE